MISVVIPAHNEEAVIGRCLRALLDGTDPDQLDVVVVCNATTDRTAEVAKEAFPGVRVYESEIASKNAAVNLGDSMAKAFPRIYLDADIELSGHDLLALAAALEAPGGPLAAAPELHVDSSQASWAVRNYYEVWTRLPYVTGDWVGGGVYALSEAGRSRFEEFPVLALGADDFFLTRIFDGPGEQQRVRGTKFVIQPPRTTKDLVNVLRRRRASHHEYAKKVGYEQPPARTEHHGRALVDLAREPRRWTAIATYGAITVAAVIGAEWKTRFGDDVTWNRDDTTRTS